MGNSRFALLQEKSTSPFFRLLNFTQIPLKMSGALKRFLPMFDRVLIQRAEAATKSKGGILIPEKAQQKVREGTVVAAGPGARNEQTGATIPMVVKVGDTVLLPEFGGTKIELEDKEYTLLRESEIVAKMAKE